MTLLAIRNQGTVSTGACAGPIDARGAVRPECRVCGKCDAIIEAFLKDTTIAAATLAARTQQPAAAA
jgi:hypothetical protein